jgi:hypothetical protein
MERIELRNMAKRWPSEIVARGEVRAFTGGAVSGKTVANFDSQGLGPEGRFRLGRQTVYPLGSLIEWLERRCSN